MDGLEHINGGLYLGSFSEGSNPKLASLTALAALQDVSGDLEIYGSGLSGLAGIEQLMSVGGYAHIKGNKSLPTCAVQAFVDGVDIAGIGAVVDEIVGRKIEQNRIVAVPQGWRMVNAIKTAERKLAEKALRHGAQPIMAWSVGNAKPEPRGNAVIITKAVAGTAKIDPLMAMLNAVSLMADNPKPRKRRHQIFFI